MTSPVPDLDQFGHDDAWRIGSALARRCRADQLPVTISIWLGDQRVFHAALPGTVQTTMRGWRRRPGSFAASTARRWRSTSTTSRTIPGLLPDLRPLPR